LPCVDDVAAAAGGADVSALNETTKTFDDLLHAQEDDQTPRHSYEHLHDPHRTFATDAFLGYHRLVQERNVSCPQLRTVSVSSEDGWRDFQVVSGLSGWVYVVTVGPTISYVVERFRKTRSRDAWEGWIYAVVGWSLWVCVVVVVVLRKGWNWIL
jgi:hypothetical protein